MRATTISLGAAAAVVLLCVAFWPEAQPGPAPRRAIAQVSAAGAPAPGTAAPAKAIPAPRKPTETEEKLAKRISVEFAETPLHDVLTYLSDVTAVQFYLNTRALDELGINADTPITLRLKDVRLDTVLDLTMEQIGGGGVGYAERDGVLMISEVGHLADRLEVHVYNCRDLLAMEVPGRNAEAGAAAAPPGLSAPGAAAPGTPMGAAGLPPGSPMGGLGGSMGGLGGSNFGVMSGFGTQHDARAGHLMQLVSQIVKPDSWSEAGGPGSIAEYGGLLVVRQNPQVHREVEQLLAMLREQAAND